MPLKQEYEQLKQQISRYDAAGDYVGLAGAMDRFLELTGLLYGEESPEFATTLNDFGGIHRDIGNYEKAEAAFIQSAEKIARLQSEQHADYGSVLNNLAGLYRLMRQYEKSAEYFQKTLEIYKVALGEQHFLYVSGLNNLGLLYLPIQNEFNRQLGTQGIIININMENEKNIELNIELNKK